MKRTGAGPRPSPPRPRLRCVSSGEFWSGLKEAFGFLANVATVAAVGGLVIAYQQYQQGFVDQRISRTLDIVGTWSERGLDDDYARLFASVDQRVRALTAAEEARFLAADDATKRMALKNLGEKVLFPIEGQEEHRARADRLFHYLKRVAVCVQEVICDEQTVRTFLLSYASDMVLYFGAYIDHRRETEWDFAREIEGFVTRAYPKGIPVGVNRPGFAGGSNF